MAEQDDLPVVTFGNLMSEGIALSRRGQHDKALGCFNDVRAPRPEGTGREGPRGGGHAATGRGSVQAGEAAAGGPTAKRGDTVSSGGLCTGGDPDGTVQGQSSTCSKENL